MYIFEEAKRRELGIGQLQVVQTALDGFINEQIHDSFHADAKVSFERVETIERERSGKLRVIVGLGPQ